jgi:hypothetical protein
VRSEVLPLSAPLVPSLAPLADELCRHVLVVASHFISSVLSQSAFVIGTGGTSAANAGAMKAAAAKSAISVFITSPWVHFSRSTFLLNEEKRADCRDGSWSRLQPGGRIFLRAEILDLAPDTGTLLNAADVAAATARAAAKTLKNAPKARPPTEIINGWEPKVQQAIQS